MRLPASFAAILGLLISIPTYPQTANPERERARQEYIQIMEKYQYEPGKALQICEVRAEREEMLRSQGRMDELDTELIARNEEWEKENKKLLQAIKDEGTTETRSDQERDAEWASNPDVAMARLRLATKKSPALQAYSLHAETSDSACKLALVLVQCHIVHCGNADGPQPIPPKMNYSSPSQSNLPSVQIYTPSQSELRRQIEMEEQAERLRKLERKVNDQEHKKQ